VFPVVGFAQTFDPNAIKYWAICGFIIDVLRFYIPPAKSKTTSAFGRMYRNFTGIPVIVLSIPFVVFLIVFLTGSDWEPKSQNIIILLNYISYNSFILPITSHSYDISTCGYGVVPPKFLILRVFIICIYALGIFPVMLQEAPSKYQSEFEGDIPALEKEYSGFARKLFIILFVLNAVFLGGFSIQFMSGFKFICQSGSNAVNMDLFRYIMMLVSFFITSFGIRFVREALIAILSNMARVNRNG
jgi:hypothetical protein